jgi:hypothetical protein
VINHIAIYKEYIGQWYEIGMVINSPLPSRNEKTPSFSTRLFPDGKIRWKDFNFKSDHGHDVIAFVVEMEASITTRDEAYAFIKAGSIKGASKSVSYKQKLQAVKVPPVYETMDLTLEHLDYFSQLLVDRQLLNSYNITGLSKASKLGRVFYKHSNDDFGFHYKIGKGEKTYRPFAFRRKDKFRMQNIDELEGYEQLPISGDLLVITKSLKDVVYLRAIGIYAVSCSSESSLNIMRLRAAELNARFKVVARWGDPDFAGKKYSYRLAGLFPNSPEIFSEIAKDPTDIQMITRNPFYNLKLISNACDKWKKSAA